MTVTIISNDIIKGALISYLKTVSAVTDKLVTYGSSISEIREYQWKGQEFEYPAIRLRIIRNSPELGECEKSNITYAWMVFTEEQSSATCDEISGIIAAYFQTQQFSVAFQGNTYNFGCGGVSLIPAISLGELTWRSEVMIEGFISKI